jgi:ABC-type transporter Mla subunit MlaD
MKKLSSGLQSSLQSMYDGMKEQYDSIDSEIAGHKKSIKNLNQMKKDIEADLEYLEGMGIKQHDEDEQVETEVDGENQTENK